MSMDVARGRTWEPPKDWRRISVIDAHAAGEPLRVVTGGIDAPAGRITAHPKRDGGRVASVAFENVPSFVLELDASVDVPGLGKIRYDLAFGGAFYAYVDVAQVGLEMTAKDYRGLIDTGWRIKRAVMAARPIPHPFEPELSFLYGTIFTGPALDPGGDTRNVCVFADGEVDRSPTGTGVSGRV